MKNHQISGRSRKYWLVAVIGSAVLFMFSCERIIDTPKDKLPAELQFEFSLQEYSLTEDKQGASNFSIDRGQLVLENIEFDGRRQQAAQSIYFISDFPDPLSIDLVPQGYQADFHFEIPQGIYDMIEMTFHLGADQHASLVMEGQFRRGNLEPVAVRFEYTYREQIRVRATPGDNQDNIIFSKEEPSTANVELNTGSLLRLVNFGMLVQAEVIEVDGQDVIFIDGSTNTGLFNSISARLNNAFTLVIE